MADRVRCIPDLIAIFVSYIVYDPRSWNLEFLWVFYPDFPNINPDQGIKRPSKMSHIHLEWISLDWEPRRSISNVDNFVSH